MAVPEGIDFYYEITQWESGKIFHYRYLLDENNDIIREKRSDVDAVPSDNVVKNDGITFKVEVKEKAKIVDPQVRESL